MASSTRDAGAFGSDQRAGYVETIFGQQEVEVVSGNPPGNVGIALADEVGILVPEFFQAGIDFSAPAAFTDDLLQFSIAGLAHLHAQAVVGEDIESFDVVVGLARHHGMHAAGVVADHAAQGAAVVGGRIGPEGQVMFFGRVAQVVENHAGLDPGNAPLGIDLHDVAHVAGEIEHQGDVAALSGERSAAAAAQERSAILARERDRGDDVVGVAGKNYADGDLAIVGSVGGVEGAAAGIETDVAAQLTPQSLFQRDHVHHRGPGGVCNVYEIIGPFFAGVQLFESPATVVDSQPVNAGQINFGARPLFSLR